MTARPCAAVVLAAGKGTRMKSEQPKVLHPLLGRPLLSYPLARLLELDIRHIVIVVGFGAEEVRAQFAHVDGRLSFTVQREQLGTGHATNQARDALAGFDGHVLIIPGDAPLIKTDTLHYFMAEHARSSADLTVMTTCLDDAGHYGRVVRGASGEVERIVEARDATPEEMPIREINAGIYLVDAPLLFSTLDRVRPANAQSEYYLTDILALARADGRAVRAWCFSEPRELAGVNNREELARVEDELRLEINRGWMQDGVTLEGPDTIRIEPDVAIEPDVVLGAGFQLRGKTRVGRNSRLEPGVVLTDVELGAGSRVGAYSVLSGVRIDGGCGLPPFTHLVSDRKNGVDAT